MSVVLVRLDDRLIHGQVVVGWVQSLNATRIVLVDDAISTSDWEQELFSLGVPPGLSLEFDSVRQAADKFESWVSSKERTIVLLGSVDTLKELHHSTGAPHRVNLGGVHQSEGRVQRLPYLYLREDEIDTLRHLAAGGVAITAQDVPTAKPVRLEEIR